MENTIEQYWQQLERMMQTVPLTTLNHAADVLAACHRRGGTVFIVGNGGSAATASHFACDLAKGTRTDGVPAFRVVALTDNVPLLTAWANDTTYEHVFAEQLAALVRAGDVVIAISTSGRSDNVVAAAEVAHAADAITLALTGQQCSPLSELADVTIRTPTGPIEQVEDLHLAIAHSLCVALRERMRAEVRRQTPLSTHQPQHVAARAVERNGNG